jgi:hypothetical protein
MTNCSTVVAEWTKALIYILYDETAAAVVAKWIKALMHHETVVLL